MRPCSSLPSLVNLRLEDALEISYRDRQKDAAEQVDKNKYTESTV